MHPYVHAAKTPDKPAFQMAATDETVTYAELDARSNQGAHLFRTMGLEAGDGVAIFMENHTRFLEVVWAAQRAGLRYTAIASRLTPGEVAYILTDSGARALITTPGQASVATAAVGGLAEIDLFMTGDAVAPFESWQSALAGKPTTPIADEKPGGPMLYSSGTTGRPKGVLRPITAKSLLDPEPVALRGKALYGMGEDTVYLCPAPLYHAAPLGWTTTVHRLGGTAIVMEKFDPEECLRLIEKHRITHAQFVPTHFVRMLKLPKDVRSKYDLSSLKVAFHAAAPCPIPVKEQMIAWWGPIIHEYYAGTEGNGSTAINAQEWLAHRGSVGRAYGDVQIKICDDEGVALPPRAEGLVYFAGGPTFAYHNDPEKTAGTRNQHGWTTLGDVGWLDEEGYLYLTDRKSFMIISGGVNIYPQEIENLLVTHPKVADAAVVGAPDDEMGEKVVAVIQPMTWAEAGDELAADLTAFCRAHLSAVKLPRRIEFMQELPRHPTGKLYKRLIRDAFWGRVPAAT